MKHKYHRGLQSERLAWKFTTDKILIEFLKIYRWNIHCSKGAVPRVGTVYVRHDVDMRKNWLRIKNF